MPKLSTHVLDTAGGVPAAGVGIELHRLQNGERILVATGSTDPDGRHSFTPATDDVLPPGHYELTFLIGSYFELREQVASRKPFLETVPVRFRMQEGERYHVPLLASPFGYTSYRGS